MDIVSVQLGTRDVERIPGIFYRAKAIHIHPTRIEMELRIRANRPGQFFQPYAGPYDVALIELDGFVEFKQGSVNVAELEDGTLHLEMFPLAICRFCQSACLALICPSSITVTWLVLEQLHLLTRVGPVKRDPTLLKNVM